MSIDQPIQFLFYPKQFRTKCKINQMTLSQTDETRLLQPLAGKKEKRDEKKKKITTSFTKVAETNQA